MIMIIADEIVNLWYHPPSQF